MQDSITIKRAILSVSDKTNLFDLASCLKKHQVDIVASAGTAEFLHSLHITTTSVESITNFPEILEGRVKTLHPHIHGGILARRDNENDEKNLSQHHIKKIDLVVVNLYRFLEKLAKKLPDETMLDHIDIGGVALIRAGGKNFSSVAVVVDPKDYGNIITQMDNNHGALPLATRKNLASKAYRHIADYDKAIADWFQGQQTTSLAKSSDKLSDKGEQHFPKHTIPLRYGENPHQTGNFLTDKTFALGAISQWQGKDLSYNNYLDLDAALRILYTTAYLRQPIAVIIKHTDPCGIAVAGDISSAFKKSFRTDPMSAFGGIIGVNRRLDEKLAQDILDLKIFFEIIIAPTIAPIAKKLLMVRKKLRLISLNPDDDDMFLHQDSYQTPDEKKYRSIMGGILQQDQDKKIINRDDCNLVAGDEPSVQEWQDLSLAMMVVKEMRSNAIAIVAGGSSLGLGGGATSRVMAAQKAVNDFLQKKHLIDKNLSPVVASDGFLPFSDNISIFAKGGIKAIIQPGGSINDDDIIANCKEKNIKLFFCHSRHFHH